MVLWLALVAVFATSRWWGPWASSRRMSRRVIANGKGAPATKRASAEESGAGTAPIADGVTS